MRHLNMGRKTYLAIGTGLVVLLAVLARSDTVEPAPPLDIVYLGRISPGEDPRYQLFIEALGGLSPHLRSRVRPHHVIALTASATRLPEAVQEALALHPALVVAPSAATARAMRQAGSSVPVVFTSFTDPVAEGVVSSIAERAEPFAGVWMIDDLDSKRLELLLLAYPGIRSVAVLLDRTRERNDDAMRRLPIVGRSLGLDVTVLLADDFAEAQRLLDLPQTQRFDAWSIPPTGLASINGPQLLERLRAWGKPVIVGSTQYVKEGAPISYAYDNSLRWPTMVQLVERVLSGESPGSIPVLRQYRPELAARPIPAEGFPSPSWAAVRRADLVFR